VFTVTLSETGGLTTPGQRLVYTRPHGIVGEQGDDEDTTELHTEMQGRGAYFPDHLHLRGAMHHHCSLHQGR
jgi:hypothetical protein